MDENVLSTVNGGAVHLVMAAGAGLSAMTRFSTGSGAAVAVFFSSFGYRCDGTSFMNVAPSHPARMTDDPLTNLRVLIKV